jgi:hypothetical protein
MARGKRVMNRMDLREQAEAAERQQREEEGGEDQEELEDEDEDLEAEDEAGDEEEEVGDEEEEEEAPKPKPKKAPKAPKAKSRSRSAKVVRMRMVWGVFSNSNQRVATFDYPKRQEAEEYAAKLSADKKATFFVQPVKEALEEKKDE